MVAVMGGVGSPYFEEFVKLCTRAFLVARKHAQVYIYTIHIQSYAVYIFIHILHIRSYPSRMYNIRTIY